MNARKSTCRLVQVESHKKSLESEIYTVFLEIYSEILHTCSMSPCQPVHEQCCLFLFRQMFGRLFCFGYLGLTTSQIIVEKHKKTLR